MTRFDYSTVNPINRHKQIDGYTDRQTETYIPTGRYTIRQTSRHVDRWTAMQADRQTDRYTGTVAIQTGRQIER